MTKQQLTRLLNYRKEHNLTRDEVHTLYKVMGTAQEFVVLKMILERKNKKNVCLKQ
jgi:ornithine cyclodeaminase/alanine dehydrogenase-like protein (mu-crystallin family)